MYTPFHLNYFHMFNINKICIERKGSEKVPVIMITLPPSFPYCRHGDSTRGRGRVVSVCDLHLGLFRKFWCWGPRVYKFWMVGKILPTWYWRHEEDTLIGRDKTRTGRCPGYQELRPSPLLLRFTSNHNNSSSQHSISYLPSSWLWSWLRIQPEVSKLGTPLRCPAAGIGGNFIIHWAQMQIRGAFCWNEKCVCYHLGMQWSCIQCECHVFAWWSYFS